MTVRADLLQKAMNESYLVLDYLEQARTLSPDEDVSGSITAAIRQLNETVLDIKYAVQGMRDA
jgi:hypothetical protein